MSRQSHRPAVAQIHRQLDLIAHRQNVRKVQVDKQRLEGPELLIQHADATVCGGGQSVQLHVVKLSGRLKRRLARPLESVASDGVPY